MLIFSYGPRAEQSSCLVERTCAKAFSNHTIIESDSIITYGSLVGFSTVPQPTIGTYYIENSIMYNVRSKSAAMELIYLLSREYHHPKRSHESY